MIPQTVTFDQSPGRSGAVATDPQAVSGSSAERRILVIGDLHGHLDRFEALLRQEGLLAQCDTCNGSGQVWEPCEHYECEYLRKCPEFLECLDCNGDGWARVKRDEVEVVLLGDVGHFGGITGSPTGDILTWRAATLWADVILWGNHDRAAFEEWHAFRGFERPHPEAYHWIANARHEGMIKLAYAAHGFLMTHAGLALAFRDQQVDPRLKEDPVAFADWINEVADPSSEGEPNQIAIRDAISRARGGSSHSGGILWRDIEEKLYTGFRQVFGHSADHKERKVRMCWKDRSVRLDADDPGRTFDEVLRGLTKDGNPSYCVDVGGKGDLPSENCLAGIYLPDEQVVRVDL